MEANKKGQNVIIKVEQGSIAEELGIEPGDILISMNGKEILDVFDYRFYMQEDFIELCIQDHTTGEECIAEIEKDYDEDIGIVFESGLMDAAKSCRNKCIFCFIDQLPPGMRETLYFKDDDSRLSFLQGNYVTLTNMSQKDIDRIIYYHLSPINISVHTTDLELRKEMLHNKNADNVLDIMRQFADAGIEMNLQVVLCKGYNDGRQLDKTIADCVAFYPQGKSMSVVPIGLTKYRQSLTPMEPFSKEEARRVLEQVHNWQNKFLKQLGSRFVFASDEFYLKAEQELPEVAAYEDFVQYENGVGMLTLLEAEFMEALQALPNGDVTRKLSLATGKAAYPLIQRLSMAIVEKRKNLDITVYEIENTFFGNLITVSGLLTGQDIIDQLNGLPLGECLLLPDSLLRNGTRTLLDDVEIEEIEEKLQVPVKTVQNDGRALLHTILNMEE